MIYDTILWRLLEIESKVLKKDLKLLIQIGNNQFLINNSKTFFHVWYSGQNMWDIERTWEEHRKPLRIVVSSLLREL